MRNTMAGKKIVILGRGYLGTRIAEHFAGSELLSADITDLPLLRQTLQGLQPDVVVNAAAKTLTGELEKPESQEEAYRVNVYGAANAALVCREINARLVHISTGMMFDGPDVREDDIPQPINYYSWTKAWADAQLVPLMDNVLITRIHTPFSKYAHPRNLLTKIQNFNQAIDVPSSLTVVEDYLQALEQLIGREAVGIYNVVNPGAISIYEAVCLARPGQSIKPLTREELAALMRESGGAPQTYPVLNTDKLQALGITMRPVREAVEECIRNYQQ